MFDFAHLHDDYCKSSGGDYSHSMVAGGFDEMS